DYVEYLAHRDIYFLIPYAEIEVLSHNHGSFIKKYLFKLNSSFIKNIQYVIPAPESDLADGLLLGARRGFDNETKEEFITTGTIHIVALSGYNISIVAKAIMYIASSFFGLASSSILGVIIIILFVLMSGAGASSVRAGVMAVIALLGRMSGRTYNASRALIIAGLLMIAFDLRVIFDISFQLSFLATFGILFITPKVIKWVMWMPSRFGLREISATTIAAQIAVLPLLLYTTGVFSFVAFPANVLILVFIPIAMLLSFIAGLLVFLSPSIALPFGYLAYVPLTYILKTIHLFAILPFASVTIKSFPLIFTIVLYMFLFYWVFVLKIKKSPSA
ncbi:ComEC/Rec2 family competence protein, partial [Candidatus Nomurabacteria bacterium]|nr:ComEC/Rec2 family competence protein [Candidatus Nomurabacteria bacterium]